MTKNISGAIIERPKHTPEIIPATKEWAYDDMEQDYNDNRDAWREVSESFYWQALEVLPPIYVAGGFLVSEPWKHTPDGRPVYAGFSQVGERYFGRQSTTADMAVYVRQLRNALGR